MFIEVTSGGEKIMLNTNEVIMMAGFVNTDVNKEFTMVTLAHPHTIRGGIGTIKLILEESYEELKKKLL